MSVHFRIVMASICMAINIPDKASNMMWMILLKNLRVFLVMELIPQNQLS